MKKLRVLVLVHEDLIPPEDAAQVPDKEMANWKTEYDVLVTLREIGHEAKPLGLGSDLSVLRQAIEEFRPHICFNLLEEFHGVGLYDQHVVSYLELLKQPYTGCNPRGLTLSHDKPLMKKILSYHRIPTPRFSTYLQGRKVKPTKRLTYPLVVKASSEDASRGISKASLVHNDEKLIERVEFIHGHVGTDALVEEYVEGRELYVGVMGNQRLQTFPVWEMVFKNFQQGEPKMATAKVKWDEDYQKKMGIDTGPADLPPETAARISKLCKRMYHVLYLSGYARMDLRPTDDGRMYVLEANANPNLSYGEDFAESAEKAGISYEKLLTRILSLGMGYHAPWQL